MNDRFWPCSAVNAAARDAAVLFEDEITLDPGLMCLWNAPIIPLIVRTGALTDPRAAIERQTAVAVRNTRQPSLRMRRPGAELEAMGRARTEAHL
jgi:hypothetical protein